MKDICDIAFAEYENRTNKWLESRPECGLCQEPIQDEYAYEIPKIGKVCERCIKDCIVYVD